jgi:hypothetical protein
VAYSPSSDEVSPTSNQVIIQNSVFKNVKTYSDGSVGLINLDTIWMKVFNTSFTSISGESNSFGGAFNAQSVG